MDESTTFKISDSVIKDLNLLNGTINEEITRKLFINSIKQIFVNGPALPIRSDIYDNEVKIEVEKAKFGVCCILLRAAQNSLDVLKLKDILNEYQINPKTIHQIVESYKKFREEFINRLSNYNTTTNIPFLVDVDYEIQQCTVSNTKEVLYQLIFKGYDNSRETVIKKIVCNSEELQLLISRLKDIERHCERISKID
ncbi:hypothetical protein PVAND_009584 [Polypedilum vanderplanki]|uniref:COMM domain-containing protein n=1 Tax=Polypedilum vanderplanki TaxID=319348 RepID=A0A9J6CEK5_POLVA|nr:hypothetical protein PVAND_009584 [Polypedilum vanderplanki]